MMVELMKALSLSCLGKVMNRLYHKDSGMKFRTIAHPLIIAGLSVLITLMATTSFAAKTEMGEEELQQVTGAGFSSFTLTEGVARASFNIVAKTYTEIDSLKMGYYDDGTTTGWDQHWMNVSFGTQETDLVVRGVYIEASFSNIADPANRVLNSIKLGTPSMTGTISANFTSFSGQIKDPGGIDLVNGHRVPLGPATITCTNSAFQASLNTSGLEKGWWMSFTNAGITYH